jgi:hypothetical protein
MAEDPVLGGLLSELEKTIEEPGPAPPGPPEELEALRADLRGLGVFGLLLAISDAPPPSEEVRAELPARIAERIRAQLAEEEAKAEAEGKPAAAAAPAGATFPALLAHYREHKGPKVLRKLVENAVYEFYDLRDHGLFVDDVARVLDLFRASTGAGDDVKAFVKGLAALSSDTAKFMLGLFPEQIQLIYKVGQRQAERREIDEAFEGFGPRAIWKRVFAIVKTLIQKEKRLRLAITLYARTQGVAISREQVLEIEKHLAVKDTGDLVKRAIARKDARAALLAFRREHADEIGALEATY